MTWGKVDDKLHGSVKWRRATKAARALWTTALSWCSDQENDGSIPADMLRYLDGTAAEAASLVSSGLWDVTDSGWSFHDWADYNPDSASQKAKRDAESTGGKRGNHARWHASKGIRVPDCEFCHPTRTGRVPESPPDRVPESPPNPPDPTRPDPSNNKTHTARKRASQLPDKWEPNDGHHAIAAERGLNLTDVAANFRDHAIANGRTQIDWDAAFRTWLRNERPPTGSRPPGRPTPSQRAADVITIGERLQAQHDQQHYEQLQIGHGS